jgi:hypothetical protein
MNTVLPFISPAESHAPSLSGATKVQASPEQSNWFSSLFQTELGSDGTSARPNGSSNAATVPHHGKIELVAVTDSDLALNRSDFGDGLPCRTLHLDFDGGLAPELQQLVGIEGEANEAGNPQNGSQLVGIAGEANEAGSPENGTQLVGIAGEANEVDNPQNGSQLVGIAGEANEVGNPQNGSQLVGIAGEAIKAGNPQNGSQLVGIAGEAIKAGNPQNGSQLTNGFDRIPGQSTPLAGQESASIREISTTDVSNVGLINDQADEANRLTGGEVPLSSLGDSFTYKENGIDAAASPESSNLIQENGIDAAQYSRGDVNLPLTANQENTASSGLSNQSGNVADTVSMNPAQSMRSELASGRPSENSDARKAENPQNGTQLAGIAGEANEAGNPQNGTQLTNGFDRIPGQPTPLAGQESASIREISTTNVPNVGLLNDQADEANRLTGGDVPLRSLGNGFTYKENDIDAAASPASSNLSQENGIDVSRFSQRMNDSILSDAKPPAATEDVGRINQDESTNRAAAQTNLEQVTTLGDNTSNQENSISDSARVTFTDSAAPAQSFSGENQNNQPGVGEYVLSAPEGANSNGVESTDRETALGKSASDDTAAPLRANRVVTQEVNLVDGRNGVNNNGFTHEENIKAVQIDSNLRVSNESGVGAVNISTSSVDVPATTPFLGTTSANTPSEGVPQSSSQDLNQTNTISVDSKFPTPDSTAGSNGTLPPTDRFAAVENLSSISGTDAQRAPASNGDTNTANKISDQRIHDATLRAMLNQSVGVLGYKSTSVPAYQGFLNSATTFGTSERFVEQELRITEPLILQRGQILNTSARTPIQPQPSTVLQPQQALRETPSPVVTVETVASGVGAEPQVTAAEAAGLINTATSADSTLQRRTNRHDSALLTGEGRSGDGDSDRLALMATSSGGREGSGNQFSQNSGSGIQNAVSAGQNGNGTNFETSEVWKDAIKDITMVSGQPDSENPELAINRLLQIAIPHAGIRQQVIPKMQAILQQLQASAKSSAQTWQKHSFLMDDGKQFDVSVRQADGAVFLKLGSLSPELNRLLQQYQQEIREHLEKTCDVEVNLEFEQPGEDKAFAGSEADKRSGTATGSEILSNHDESGTRTKSSGTTRTFGYNRNEWTA